MGTGEELDHGQPDPTEGVATDLTITASSEFYATEEVRREAAEWVDWDVQHRLELRRARLRSLGRRLLAFLHGRGAESQQDS